MNIKGEVQIGISRPQWCMLNSVFNWTKRCSFFPLNNCLLKFNPCAFWIAQYRTLYAWHHITSNKLKDIHTWALKTNSNWLHKEGIYWSKSMAWLVKYSDSPIRRHCHIFSSTIPVGQPETLAFCTEVFSFSELMFASWWLHQSYILKDDVFPLLIFFNVPHKYFVWFFSHLF